jgi:hypothetical protein
MLEHKKKGCTAGAVHELHCTGLCYLHGLATVRTERLDLSNTVDARRIAMTYAKCVPDTVDARLSSVSEV